MEITGQAMSGEQRAEVFREFQAEHLRRQTRALESIRSILIFFVVLFVIGVVLWLLALGMASTGSLY